MAQSPSDVGALVRYLRSETAGAFLEVAVAACRELAGADNAALSVIGEGGVQFVELSGFDAQFRRRMVDSPSSFGVLAAQRRGRPLFIPAYQGSPQSHPAFRAAGVQSVYHLPVQVGEDVSAVLSLGWQRTVGRPSGKRDRVLRAMAEEIGHALHRRDLLAALALAQCSEQRRAAMHRALLAVGERAVLPRTEHELYDEVCSALVESGPDLTLAWVALAQGGRLELAAAAGPAARTVTAELVRQGTLGPLAPAARCAQEGRPLLWPDPSESGSAANGAALSVPLRHDGHVFGVLSVATDSADVLADGQVRALLERMAENAAMAAGRRRLQIETDLLARRDPLTGLGNLFALREGVAGLLAGARSAQRRLAVLVLVLRNFEELNDVLGYDAGDASLRAVAAALADRSGPGDFVARSGGAEFTFVAAVGGEAEADGLARDTVLAVETALEEGLGRSAVTCVLGAALDEPDRPAAPDELLRQAHMAMNRAMRGSGAAVVRFTAEMAADVLRTKTLRDELARGIDAGELRLHYQPQVELQSGRVVGYEALVRWVHPQRGLLMPGHFLPAIEGHPLMLRLGTWVLEAALAQLAAWTRQGRQVEVNVNVAAVQLADARFAGKVRDALARHPEVRPRDLVLEILESSALVDLDTAMRQMDAVRRLGVRWALDDFGTGYSSLSHLQRLAVDEVKMDQSFTRAVLDDVASLSVLNGLAAAVLPLGRTLVAEGVEEASQGAVLLDLGCAIAQGYAISRPLPAEELEGWQRTWQPPQVWTRGVLNLRRWDYLLLLAGWQEEESRLVQGCLSGQTAAPPPANHCRLGAWCEGPGQDRFGGVPIFHDIDRLHRDLHEAMQRLQVVREGQGDEEQAALELAQCSASLYARMEEIYRMMRDS